MSWQGYIDSSLVGSGHIDKAAIISAAGDSAWATSSGFTIDTAEMKAIAAIFKGDQAQIDKSFSEGVHVATERYVATIISPEDNIITIRKGKEGIVIAKTTQAIVVGHYGENAQPGNARSTVESLADYLRKAGY